MTGQLPAAPAPLGANSAALGRSPAELGWLLNEFVRRQPDVAHAIVLSEDGLPIALSDTLPASRAEQLAAIVSGLISLTEAAARSMEAGNVIQTSVDMDLGYLFLMSMGHGAQLGVLASPECEMGLLAYEMTSLVVRVGRRLAPNLRPGPADGTAP